MPTYALKPRSTRLHKRAGAPTAWLLMDGPRKTFPGDTGDVADVVLRRRAATRNGGCVWSTGVSGACLRFDGIGGTNALLPDLINLGTNYFFSVSVYYTAPANSILLSSTSPGTGGDGGYFGTFSNLMLLTVDDGTVNVNASFTPSLNRWYRLGVRRRETAVQFYVDGQPYDAEKTLGSNSASALSFIGARYNDTFPHTGLLDDVRVWMKVTGMPSDAEVARNYGDPWWRLRRQSRIAQFFYANKAATPPTNSPDPEYALVVEDVYPDPLFAQVNPD